MTIASLPTERLHEIRNNAIKVAAEGTVNTEKTMAALQVALLAELIFEIRALREEGRDG